MRAPGAPKGASTRSTVPAPAQSDATFPTTGGVDRTGDAVVDTAIEPEVDVEVDAGALAHDDTAHVATNSTTSAAALIETPYGSPGKPPVKRVGVSLLSAIRGSRWHLLEVSYLPLMERARHGWA